MKKSLLVAAVGGTFLFLLASCGGNKESQPAEGVDTTAQTKEDTLSGKSKEMVDFKFFYTIANLPSPMEMISSISQSNVPFSKDLLNPTSNMQGYNTTFKKGVNYGVYGIDMAYTAFYGQNQDLLDYYSNTRKLAERMNLLETFDKFTSSFEKNSGNKDSLVTIIDRAYSETDSYLKANNRYMTASHVLAGALLEAQYLSVELMKNQEKNAQNAGIYDRIFNQKLYLENLISLYKELSKDPESAKLKSDMENLKKAYDGLKGPEDLNKEMMAKLSAEITKVRSSLIK